MSLPFPKSVFLEFLRYPIFADFVRASNLLDVPEDIDSSAFQRLELKKYKRYLGDNKPILENLLDIFLQSNPAFWGIVFAINKMAAEITVNGAADKNLILKREGFILNKIKFIADCIIQSRLPGYDPELIKLRISKGINRFHDSFDFKSKLIDKVTLDQNETIKNLHVYALSIVDRFVPNLKNNVINKLNTLMSSDDAMKNYFDRVVIINLDKRKDRWDAIQDKLSKIKWPFKEPERFAAYDGSKLPVPIGWTYGEGTWGCLLSHREVLSQAIRDGLDNVLVLEDDIFFAPDFESRVVSFIKAVPMNWDQIMLGGQFFDSSKAYDISPEARKVSLCHRAHAYAVRGNFMRYMYSKLCASYGHVDHIMNTFQDRFNVYTPQHFLIGQDGSPSDISGRKASPDLMRNPPDKDTPVFVVAPDVDLHQQVVSSDLPLHFGSISEEGASAELKRIAFNSRGDKLSMIQNMLLSSIWYARSVYPSKYSVILNPAGWLTNEILDAKGKLNLIYIESMDQLKEAISKYPFGEDLPTQFPEENQQT